MSADAAQGPEAKRRPPSAEPPPMSVCSSATSADGRWMSHEPPPLDGRETSHEPPQVDGRGTSHEPPPLDGRGTSHEPPPLPAEAEEAAAKFHDVAASLGAQSAAPSQSASVQGDGRGEQNERDLEAPTASQDVGSQGQQSTTPSQNGFSKEEGRDRETMPRDALDSEDSGDDESPASLARPGAGFRGPQTPDLWNAVPAKTVEQAARRHPSRSTTRSFASPNMVFSFVDQVSDSISGYLLDIESQKGERSQKEDLKSTIFDRKVVVYDRNEKAEQERWNAVMTQAHKRSHNQRTGVKSSEVHECRPPHKLFFEEPKILSDGQPALSFSSAFESGNLETAGCDRVNNYSLLLAHDVHTQGYTHWFYFAVKGGIKGWSATFNITNMSKAKSLFEGGRMKPVVWSEKAGRGWERGCSNVMYVSNRHRQCSNVGERGRTYRTLAFTYTFEHDDDVVFFAYHYPYTYSHLHDFLDYLCAHPTASTYIQSRTPLCRTIGDLECEAVEISEMDYDIASQGSKPVAVVTARVHPGEANSSWMMQGFLQFLCSDTDEASALRRRRTWLVVPMLNPDGVVLGNYRCGLAGVDLNRCFIHPSERLHPEVWNLQDRLSRCAVDIYVDFHGHSKKEGIFFYGGRCHASDAEDAAANAEIKLLPWLCSQASTDFKYKECRFAVEPSKKCTARLFAFLQLGVRQAFTVEASFCGPGRTDPRSSAATTCTGGSTLEDFTPTRLALAGPTIGRSLLVAWQGSSAGDESYPPSFHSSRQGSKDSTASGLFNGNEVDQWPHLQYSRLKLSTAKQGLQELIEREQHGGDGETDAGEDSGSDSNPDADRETGEALKAIQKKLMSKLKRRRRLEEAEGAKNEQQEEQKFKTIIAFGKSMRVPLRDGASSPSSPTASPLKFRTRTLDNLDDRSPSRLSRPPDQEKPARRRRQSQGSVASPSRAREPSTSELPDMPMEGGEMDRSSSSLPQAPQTSSQGLQVKSPPPGHMMPPLSQASLPHQQVPRNSFSEDGEEKVVLASYDADHPSAQIAAEPLLPPRCQNTSSASTAAPSTAAATPERKSTTASGKPSQPQPHLVSEALRSRVHILPRSGSGSFAGAAHQHDQSERACAPQLSDLSFAPQLSQLSECSFAPQPSDRVAGTPREADRDPMMTPARSSVAERPELPRPHTACAGMIISARGAPAAHPGEHGRRSSGPKLTPPRSAAQRPMSACGSESNGHDEKHGVLLPVPKPKAASSASAGMPFARGRDRLPNASLAVASTHVPALDVDIDIDIARSGGCTDHAHARPMTAIEASRPHRKSVVASRQQHFGESSGHDTAVPHRAVPPPPIVPHDASGMRRTEEPGRAKVATQTPMLPSRDVPEGPPPLRAPTPLGGSCIQRPATSMGIANSSGLRSTSQATPPNWRRRSEVNAASTWCRVLKTSRGQTRKSDGP